MSEQKFHPTLLVKPATVSRRDILRAERLGGICIVECQDPEAARFVEPPTLLSTDALANAAMSLVRFILAQSSQYRMSRDEISKWYVDCLLKGAAPFSVQAVPPAERVKRG